jgi:Ca2+-binding EF-hand superfamily protein
MSIYKSFSLGFCFVAILATPILADGPRAGRDHGPRMVFADLDLNADGALTLDELESAPATRFANSDANNDGLLSRDELLAQGRGRLERGVDRMLSRVDTNQDGAISLEEMTAARANRPGPTPQRMFGRMDANDDGQITQAEFDDAVARMRARHAG